MTQRVNDNDVLSTAEACEILHVSVASITRWVRTGYLPTVRRALGTGKGRHLFDRSVVEELAAERLAAKAALDWSMRRHPAGSAL